MTEIEAREQILMTALTLFAEKGFGKTSMNDIVEASQLSKGGIYWHFRSKNELITTVFDQFFQAQLTMIDTILDKPGAAGDKLQQLVKLASAETTTMAQQFPSPLEFYALAARDETLRQHLLTFFQSYRERFAALMQQGMESGEFTQQPVQPIADTFIGLFEGLLLVWAIQPEAFDLGVQLETAVALFLAGLQQEQSS